MGESFSSQPKKIPALSVNTLPDVNIPPKEHVTYTKQTQTIQTNEREGIFLHSIFVYCFRIRT